MTTADFIANQIAARLGLPADSDIIGTLLDSEGDTDEATGFVTDEE